MNLFSPSAPPPSRKSRPLLRGYLFAAALLALLVLPGDHTYAAVEAQLTPSAAAPQPVGTTIVWTTSAADTNAGALHYQYSVQPPGGAFAVVRDFSPSNSFEWTPSEREGVFNIRVTVKNTDTSETLQTAAGYTVSSHVPGGVPVITATSNPLVALYSAPACSGGSMRVRFWRTGDFSSRATPWKSCVPGVSRNFYVAGMLAATQYSIRHEISSHPAAPADVGPTLSFTTGTPPAGLFPTFTTPIAPPIDSGQDVIFHAHLFAEPSNPFYLSATNLSGQPLWYYDRKVRYATRPTAAGTALVISNSRQFSDTLSEIDLAGHTVRETNVQAVSEQLLARGEQSITHFHHEARRLPNGNTAVLCGNERLMSDVQGPGPVAIVGDMIVVLDQNWQVIWSWNGFDHMDVKRKALLDEKCVGAGCFSNFAMANDWLHSNSISYEPADGNFLVSMRHQDWVVKIDYRDGLGTGEVLWRLGKDGDFTIDSSDPYPWFSHQHDAAFDLGGTQLILYDNGNIRRLFPNATGNSRGQVFTIDEANRKASLQLNADLGEYASALGSAQKLADGNYHFLSGVLPRGSQSVEVRPDGTISFILQSQAIIYRSFRMRDLYTPGDFKSEASQEAQTITFGPIANQTLGVAPFAVSATASSGLPVEIRVVSGPATISGGTLTITGAGTVTLQADQHGNIKYNEAKSVRRSFAVRKDQSITFAPLPGRTFGDAPFELSASSSSALPVSFRIQSGPATIQGNALTITGAGTVTVRASQAGDADFNPAPDVERSFAVAKAPATLSLVGLSQIYDGSVKAATVTTSPAGLAGVSLSYTRNGAPAGSPVNAGSYEVVATLSNANYQATDAAATLVIAKADQAINFAALPARTFGDQPFALSATSTSDLPVTFQIVSGPANVAGRTVTLTGAGEVVIRASQVGDGNHNAAPDVEQTVGVAKKGQTISLAAIPDKTFGGAPFALTATATSALPVSFSIVSGPATVSGSTVTITGAGAVTVRASQAGDANHNAATDVDRSFAVSKAQAALSLSNLSQTYDGSAKFAAAATNPAGLAGVTVSYTKNKAPVGAPTDAGSYEVVATLSNANYQATDAAATLVIAKADQAINFAALPARTFGDQPFALSATSSSGLPVNFVVVSGPANVAGRTVTLTGAGGVVIRASQVGDGNHNAAPHVERSVGVAKQGQTISFGALPDKTFGDAPFELSAASSSGLPVTYAVVSGPAAVSGNTLSITGAGAVVIRASQAGSADYNAAPGVEQPLAVGKATPLITWDAPADISVGTPLGGTQLNATAGVPGTFTYNPTAGTVLPEGRGHVLFARFTPTDSANYAVARARVELNVLPVLPMLLTIENSERAWALTSVTELPGPFSILDERNFSADRHTRVMLFALNLDLSPDGDASALTAEAEDAQGRVFALPIDFVGKVPNHVYLTQVTVRLTDELAGAGDVRVSIKLRGAQSNRALISIKP